MIFLGFDPGVSGGMAMIMDAVGPMGHPVVEVQKFDGQSESDIAAWVRSAAPSHANVMATLEHVKGGVASATHGGRDDGRQRAIVCRL